MTIDRKNCPMRHAETGNCLVAGGFCVDAVSDEICEALHNAYDSGYYDALRAQQEAEKNEPLTLKELKRMVGEPTYLDGHGWVLVGEDNRGCEDEPPILVFVSSDMKFSVAQETYKAYGEIAYRHPPKEATDV